MSPRMRGIVAVVIVVALVLTVVAAVVGAVGSSGSPRDGSSSPRVVTPKPVDDPPRKSLAGFYGKRLDWKPCTKGFVCTRVRVPMDYRHPKGRQLQIALEMRPASGKRIGAMLINPGGPGGSGLEYVQSASLAFKKPILEHYDLVGFDPRGVGQSDPINCLTDKQLDAYLAEDPDPDTPAEVAAYAAWSKRMGHGCVKRSGALASHVSTTEAARDMDIIRSSLGERRLTYFGASYGTKLGAVYASLFPAKVGRFVLDGSLDPELGNLQLNLQQATGFETALRAYVQNCVSTTKSCFLGSTVDAGLARIKTFLEQTDAQPLRTGTSRRLTEGLALTGIVLPLYDRSDWLLLSEGLRAAFSGDGSTLLQLADIYADRGKHGYTDNGQEALNAIDCLDDPSSLTAAQIPGVIPEFEQASPTLGRAFAWMNMACAGQEAKSTEPPVRIKAEGARPIIVTGTTRDPATPLAWAKSLASELASAVLITRDGDGHTAYNQGSACVDNAIDAYLIQGKVPKNGLACS